MGFPGGSAGKESTCNVRDLGSIPGLGRSPGEGKGYPLQYSGLENSTDSIVHGVAKSRTRLSGFHFTSLQTMNKEILFEFFFQIFFLGVRERSGGNSLHYRPTRFSCVTKTAPKVWGLPSPPLPQLPGLQAPQDPAAPSSPALGRVIRWQRRKPALQGWSPRRKDSWAMKCDQLRRDDGVHCSQSTRRTRGRQVTGGQAGRGRPAAEQGFSQAAAETWAFTLHNAETAPGDEGRRQSPPLFWRRPGWACTSPTNIVRGGQQAVKTGYHTLHPVVDLQYEPTSDLLFHSSTKRRPFPYGYVWTVELSILAQRKSHHV